MSGSNNELNYLMPESGGLIFVCGKGGVGKTTFSAMLAVHFSGFTDVFVTSIDPAHHLGNVLGVKLSHEITKVMNSLFANEANIDVLIKKYFEDTIETLKITYKEIDVYNLGKYLEMLKDSPGIEEDALYNYIREVRRLSFSVKIIDTPPTGITTRIIKLPWIQSMWLDKLISLRGKIIGYRETIESVSSGKRVRIKDPILEELLKLKDEAEDMKAFLADTRRTKILVVTTPEKLPMLELARFYETMRNIGIKVQGIVLNKFIGDEKDEKYLDILRQDYPDIPIIVVPYYNEDIIGVEKIMKLLGKVRVITQ